MFIARRRILLVQWQTWINHPSRDTFWGCRTDQSAVRHPIEVGRGKGAQFGPRSTLEMLGHEEAFQSQAGERMLRRLIHYGFTVIGAQEGDFPKQLFLLEDVEEGSIYAGVVTTEENPDSLRESDECLKVFLYLGLHGVVVANIDYREARRGLAKARKEGFKLVVAADVIGKHGFQEVRFVVIEGDPKRQAPVDVYLLLGEVFRDSLGNFLGSHTSSLEALEQEFSVEHQFVAIYDANYEGILVRLEIIQARYLPVKSRNLHVMCIRSLECLRMCLLPDMELDFKLRDALFEIDIPLQHRRREMDEPAKGFVPELLGRLALQMVGRHRRRATRTVRTGRASGRGSRIAFKLTWSTSAT